MERAFHIVMGLCGEELIGKARGGAAAAIGCLSRPYRPTTNKRHQKATEDAPSHYPKNSACLLGTRHCGTRETGDQIDKMSPQRIFTVTGV